MIDQKWSESQKEIWKNVETYTGLITKGNVKEFIKYFHADYAGWNYCEFLPVSKADVENELSSIPKCRPSSYKITPVAINRFNDVAIVHYYYSTTYNNANGKQFEKKGRNTDIVLKQKDKWVLIGDHVGFYHDKQHRKKHPD